MMPSRAAATGHDARTPCRGGSVTRRRNTARRLSASWARAPASETEIPPAACLGGRAAGSELNGGPPPLTWTAGFASCRILHNLSARRDAVAKISDYLKTGEVAAYLGVHTDTLRRWDRAGKLEARRHSVNRFRLYLKRDLEVFLARIGRQQPTKKKSGGRRSTRRSSRAAKR